MQPAAVVPPECLSAEYVPNESMPDDPTTDRLIRLDQWSHEVPAGGRRRPQPSVSNRPRGCRRCRCSRASPGCPPTCPVEATVADRAPNMQMIDIRRFVPGVFYSFRIFAVAEHATAGTIESAPSATFNDLTVNPCARSPPASSPRSRHRPRSRNHATSASSSTTRIASNWPGCRPI